MKFDFRANGYNTEETNAKQPKQPRTFYLSQPMMNSARPYQNVVVYEPVDESDVQMLIDYLKRREPAIINLDKADVSKAQRILDSVSGAIYALSGSVHKISGQIYLLTPEGVEITIPVEER